MNDEQKAKADCRIQEAWRCLTDGMSDIFVEFLDGIASRMKRSVILYPDNRRLLVGLSVEFNSHRRSFEREIEVDIVRVLNSCIKDNHFGDEDMVNLERHFSRCLAIVRKEKRRHQKP